MQCTGSRYSILNAHLYNLFYLFPSPIAFCVLLWLVPFLPNFCFLISDFIAVFLFPSQDFLLNLVTYIHIWKHTQHTYIIYAYVILNLKSAYEKDHISVWIWLISLNTEIPSCIHFLINAMISFFNDSIKFHCICVAWFLHPLSCWCTTRLPPFLGYCK